MIDRATEPHTQDKPNLGVVYILRAEGTNLYKIGYSKLSAESRRDAMQTGCPFDLTVVSETCGTLEDEQRMHEMFASKRKRGEWFELDLGEVWRAVSELTEIANKHTMLSFGVDVVLTEYGWLAERIRRRLELMNVPNRTRVAPIGAAPTDAAIFEALKGARMAVWVCSQPAQEGGFEVGNRILKIGGSRLGGNFFTFFLWSDLRRWNDPESHTKIYKMARDIIRVSKNPPRFVPGADAFRGEVA